MLRIQPSIVAELKAAATPAELHRFLQAAIELEHSTIPPYLTAYFTLKLGHNQEISAIIRGIVIEEMLHMAIAANVLLAIGGSPQIDSPRFIPSYPGPLPMHVGDGLIVGLAKFSKDLVRETFMEIEEPEQPLEFPVRAAVEAGVPGPEFATIGQFYQAIIDKIKAFGNGIFVGDRHCQVTNTQWFPEDQLFPIMNVETSTAALEMIVREGEGTPNTPLDLENEYAHYYRFTEIFHGRQLKANPSSAEGYAYNGPEIPFDPKSVWDMASNPKAVQYPQGTRARRLVNQFNYAYTKLLSALHLTFNGQPDHLDTAMGLMYELRLLAQEVLATPSPVSDTQTGLPFEYAPVNI